MFNDTTTTEISTLSLHDALPIFRPAVRSGTRGRREDGARRARRHPPDRLHHRHHRAGRQDGESRWRRQPVGRSEEHTSELQSRQYLVCRLLLEKKKKPAQTLILL